MWKHPHGRGEDPIILLQSILNQLHIVVDLLVESLLYHQLQAIYLAERLGR